MSERARRFRLIADGSDPTLRELAQKLSGEDGFELVREPEVGMVMMRATDIVEGIPFNLGEVLVTQAEVEVGGKRGWFMVMGRNARRALDGAIIDAAAEASHPMWEEAEKALLADREAMARRRRREWGEIMKTKVDFEEV